MSEPEDPDPAARRTFYAITEVLRGEWGLLARHKRLADYLENRGDDDEPRHDPGE